MTEENTTKRGRKPSPLTAVIRSYEKAENDLNRARRASEKLADVALRLNEAEENYTKAHAELQTALGNLPGIQQ